MRARWENKWVPCKMTLKISTATISIRYVSFLYVYWKFVFQFSTKVFHIFIFIFIFEGKYWVHSFRREQWLGDWEAGMFRWKDPSSAILMCYNIQWVEIQFRSTNGMLSRCKSDFIQFSLHLFVCLFVCCLLHSFFAYEPLPISLSTTFSTITLPSHLCWKWKNMQDEKEKKKME